MNFKPSNFNPHASHVMGKWESTILAPSGTERFYDIRKCVNCGCSEAKGNAHLADDELEQLCEGDVE